MTDSILVEARGLAKRYAKTATPRERLRALWSLLRRRQDVPSVEVLKPLDIEVRRGESLAIIGENGAGKSTLLKLLTGVLTPTSGSVAVHGSVGALLELGAGFHPEFTGRENVRNAAVLMGMGHAELRERMDDILAFADIGDYIDEPVKHYSSGMVVRLGFAVVAAMRPDLLITDEVLAVGDESFQKKCVRWLEDYLGAGGTLLLVSHSMFHVQKLCARALWLREGAVEAQGDVFEVSQAYLAWHERKGAQASERPDPQTYSGEAYRLLRLALNGIDAAIPATLANGATLTVEAEVLAPDDRPPVLAVGLVRADGTPVYGVTSDMDGAPPQRLAPRHFSFRLRFPDLSLLPGSYSLRVHPMDPEGIRLFETEERGITVRGESREFGMVRLPHQWG
ncbi:MAG TPA: ABC transporter ATP-binding protein [Xanthomonadaceae bacterium]|nr:ABC transporter ATP-binding protein [Xanthomonadaceae bacterium]